MQGIAGARYEPSGAPRAKILLPTPQQTTQGFLAAWAHADWQSAARFSEIGEASLAGGFGQTVLRSWRVLDTQQEQDAAVLDVATVERSAGEQQFSAGRLQLSLLRRQAQPATPAGWLIVAATRQAPE
jgi:hypothetical protein